MKHSAAKAGALLSLIVLGLPSWSAAQTNSPSIPSSTTGALVGVARLTNELPTLVQVTNAPLGMLFKCYAPGGHNFCLKFSPGPVMFFIADVGMEVKDRYGRTRYFIKKFEQKKEAVTNFNIPEERDISELTLQGEGGEPVVLVYLQEKTVSERIARVVCPGSTKTQNVYLSQYYLRCGDAGYKIDDIKPDRMIIMDVKSGEKETIPLSAPTQ